MATAKPLLHGVATRAYIDDISQGVSGPSAEDEATQLRAIEGIERILVACASVNWHISLSKMQPLVREAKYYGRRISAAGQSLLPGTIKGIEGLMEPTDLKGLQSLLGALGQLRIFIPDFAELEQRIASLEEGAQASSRGRKSIKPVTEGIKEVLLVIKRRLRTHHTMGLIGGGDTVVWMADSSATGVGGILFTSGQDAHALAASIRSSPKPIVRPTRAMAAQLGEEFLRLPFWGDLKLVEFASFRRNGWGELYDGVIMELRGLVAVARKWERYLISYNKYSLCLFDHQALERIEPTSSRGSKFIVKSLCYLSRFLIVMCSVPGAVMGLADFASRHAGCHNSQFAFELCSLKCFVIESFYDLIGLC